MKYLLTVRVESRGREIWQYAVTEDPAEWLWDTQEYEDEVYFLVNTKSITEEQAQRFDGKLRGM